VNVFLFLLQHYDCNKNLRVERIPEINKKLFDVGISTTHNFIVGNPTETDEDLRMNVELMLKLKAINPFVRVLAFLMFPLPFTPITKYVKDMGHKLPSTLREYEDADFVAKNELGMKFRPWLDKDRFYFLTEFCQVFSDAFQTHNNKLSEKSQKILDTNSKLREIFKGVETVNSPSTDFRPYLLDRVLKKEKIDLLHDLQKNA